MRKPSAETENRTLKAEIKRLTSRLTWYEREIRERRRYGGMLANVAYNLAKRPGVEPELKAVLDECRKAWDFITQTVA